MLYLLYTRVPRYGTRAGIAIGIVAIWLWPTRAGKIKTKNFKTSRFPRFLVALLLSVTNTCTRVPVLHVYYWHEVGA